MKYVYILLAILAVVAVAGIVWGESKFVPQTPASKASYLFPTDAKNITDKGNSWFSFELDGQKFLLHNGQRLTVVTVP